MSSTEVLKSAIADYYLQKIVGVKLGFHPNSRALAVSYKHNEEGKYDGLYEEWYDNGSYRIKCLYKDGKYDGLYEEWHKGGNLKTKCNYKDGELQGLKEEWDEMGLLIIE